MSGDLIAEWLAHHSEGMMYELRNYQRSIEVGFMGAAGRSLADAARHAAIATELRQALSTIRAGGGK